MGDTTLTVDEKGRVLEATKLALVRGWDISVGSSFLLCDEVYATNFQKTTKGGIQGYRYADLTGRISDRELESAESVAKALSMQSWE